MLRLAYAFVGRIHDPLTVGADFVDVVLTPWSGARVGDHVGGDEPIPDEQHYR